MVFVISTAYSWCYQPNRAIVWHICACNSNLVHLLSRVSWHVSEGILITASSRTKSYTSVCLPMLHCLDNESSFACCKRIMCLVKLVLPGYDSHTLTSKYAWEFIRHDTIWPYSKRSDCYCISSLPPFTRNFIIFKLHIIDYNRVL